MIAPPISTIALFPRLESMLIELLDSLRPEEWELQTVAPRWKVKDVAAHLLDTQLRKLSIARDGYRAESPSISSTGDLAALINRLNEEGVRIYRRLSPRVLIALLESASRESIAYHESLDPHAPALFPVSWAGEQQSENWFDTAREFTERWHHQQQIRLAVGRPGIMTREMYHPVLDCFMRALPFTYRDLAGPNGTIVRFSVAGECGGDWYLYRGGDEWRLVESAAGPFLSETTIPQELAWRIFTKGIDRASAAGAISVSGDSRIGSRILDMVSIVA